MNIAKTNERKYLTAIICKVIVDRQIYDRGSTWTNSAASSCIYIYAVAVHSSRARQIYTIDHAGHACMVFLYIRPVTRGTMIQS